MKLTDAHRAIIRHLAWLAVQEGMRVTAPNGQKASAQNGSKESAMKRKTESSKEGGEAREILTRLGT